MKAIAIRLEAIAIIEQLNFDTPNKGGPQTLVASLAPGRSLTAGKFQLQCTSNICEPSLNSNVIPVQTSSK